MEKLAGLLMWPKHAKGLGNSEHCPSMEEPEESLSPNARFAGVHAEMDLSARSFRIANVPSLTASPAGLKLGGSFGACVGCAVPG